MHIVLANKWFPPESGWGGIAVYNRTLAEALATLGHQVTVIASRAYPDIPPFQVVNGVRVQRLLVREAYRWRRLPGAGRYVRPIQQLAHCYRVAHLLRVLHNKKPIDVVEFADVNAEGFFYARNPSCAVVVRCHTPTFVLRQYYSPSEMSYDTRITSWLEKDAIRRAHALTAPSAHMARTIARECRLPLEHISVIPNALSSEAFLASSSAQSNEHITILYVGRIERAKGVTILAEAVPAILHEVPNARFAFVGEDRQTGDGKSQRAELERQFTKVGVSSSVEFVGPVDITQLADWYRKADVCVVPSMLYESFSYTSAQAMAAGKPVVASRVGGIPETVVDGVHGILVRPGQAEELAQAITRLARHAELRERMGRAGREWAEAEFSSPKVVDKTLRVYECATRAFCQTSLKWSA